MGLVNNYQFELLDTLPTSSMTVRISNEKENGAVATFTDQYITLRSDDNSIVERVKGSAAAGVLTLTKRGLDQSDVDNEVVGLKKEWREGTKAFVTYVASQHVDAKGNNTFSGTQTFTNIVVNNNSTLANVTVSGKYKGPVVADVTARNLLYPTPIDGNIVQVESIGIQYYKTSAGGWVTLDEGTPTPDATEAVKGKARIATTIEVTAGTDDNTIVTPLKANSLKTPEALFEKDDYIAGEIILANDSLFVESLPTFAESTVVQNIGDVTGNTRVSILGFGSGVASNTLKLSLRKFVSPSANLSVRIETVSGGNPTGSLVDPNATATVTAASITTSLVDTTITLAGSITITKGQQVAIVLSQVGDVVNGTNYYGVGFVARDTSTRGYSVYSGIARNPQPSADGTNVLTNIGTNPSDLGGTHTVKYGVNITMNQNSYLTSITKSSLTTATTAYLLNSGGTTIATATFSGNIATFSPQLLTNGTSYSLVVDSLGSPYTAYFNGSMTYPDTYTRFNTTGGYGTFGTTRLYCITDITTQGQVFITNGPANPNNFFYTSSTLFENRVLSKTSATYSYKLPTDYVRIATQGYGVGQSVTSKYFGLHTYPGLTDNTVYYVSNTPGAISSSAGANSYKIGKYTTNKLVLPVLPTL